MNRALSFVVALVLCGFGIWFVQRPRPGEPRLVETTPTRASTPALDELATRIEDLERRAREAALPVPERSPVDAAAAASLTGILERLERLEQRMNALEPVLGEEVAAVRRARDEARSNAELAELFAAAHAEPIEGEEPDPEAEAEERLQRMTDAEYAILDPASTIAEVLAAHESLRRVEDAYTPEMVAVLRELGDTSTDPEVRGDIWRLFDGSSHLPEIVPSLLRALDDPDFRVRREAAETLGNYADDPVVLAALRRAAESDPHPDVRERALRTVRGN